MCCDPFLKQVVKFDLNVMYGVVYISVTQTKTKNPSFNVDTQIEILSVLFKIKHVAGRIRLANNALIVSTVQIRY